MRKNYFTAFLLALSFLGLLTGCGGSKTPPLSERIAKVWTARVVNYGTNTVYTRGATSNVQNYANYKLDLSKPPTVEYTELDNNKFVGQYSVQGDTRLILTNLNPSPTGDNGTIEFKIDGISDNELKITRTTASVKTGNTINSYTLSNP
ncbi:hypothetical protein ACFSUS_17095 [Spirosoma soli]|uniref:Lipocalin-like domain-containing protein n=1 Tax=Spirosoma soli TaxID=1770529 RepID=A0ABW5M6Q2_9BACT